MEGLDEKDKCRALGTTISIARHIQLLHNCPLIFQKFKCEMFSGINHSFCGPYTENQNVYNPSKNLNG